MCCHQEDILPIPYTSNMMYCPPVRSEAIMINNPPLQQLHQPEPQYQYSSKDTKLNFEPFKPSTSYINWKAMCLLKISAHLIYKTIIILNNIGDTVLNENMTPMQSQTLYLYTMKALGNQATGIVGP